MWIILALLVALGTSTQDVLIKRMTQFVNSYVVIWAWVAFSLPFLVTLLLIEGVPVLDQTFWLILAIDSPLFALALIFYVKALENSDLSLSLPMLSFTPLFMLVTSPLILHEYPNFTGMLGVALIVIGSYVLNFKDFRRGWWVPFHSLIKDKGTRYMLIVAALFSIGANLDKLAVIHSSPVAWMTFLNLAVLIFLTGVLLRKEKRAIDIVCRNWKNLLVLGFFNAASCVIQLIAILLTQAPYLIAVKRTSIIFSVFYGMWFLKENTQPQRWLAIGLMVAGIFILSFFH